MSYPTSKILMTKKIISNLFILLIMHEKVGTRNTDYDRIKFSNINGP
jgi:hypothetical protein